MFNHKGDNRLFYIQARRFYLEQMQQILEEIEKGSVAAAELYEVLERSWQNIDTWKNNKT